VTSGPKLKFAPRLAAGPKAIQAGPKTRFQAIGDGLGLHYHD
jgi:hypothetical protein